MKALLLPTLSLAALAAAPSAQGPYGFATDLPSYEPGDTIQIYGNWDASAGSFNVTYALKRIDRFSDALGPDPLTTTSVADSGAVTYGSSSYPRPVTYGSFVDFQATGTPKIGGRNRFSLEGWVLPTWVPGVDQVGTTPTTSDDVVVIAGQIGLASGVTDPDADVLANTIAGPGGIGFDRDGHLFGAVTIGGTLHVLDGGAMPLPGGNVIDRADWHHVALTYDSNAERLRLFLDGDVVDAEEGVTGTVDTGSMNMRLGARAEAPGDLTGCYDGRLDDWAFWNRELSIPEMIALAGGYEITPVGQGAPVRLLHLKFEETYAQFNPSLDAHVVIDSAGTPTNGTVINHGTPGMEGFNVLRPSAAPEGDAYWYDNGGHSLRLNHDQVVNVDWTSEASIAIPSGAAPGLYLIEAIQPSGTGTTEGDRSRPENFRCVVVRPPDDYTPPSGEEFPPVAVIVPVNTWNAYNGWPGSDTGATSAAGLTQRVSLLQNLSGDPAVFASGNNSAYSKMADGFSTAHFHGWRRPNESASPYLNQTSGRLYYSVRAAAAVRFVEWLDATAATLESDDSGDPTGFTYHVFTDWDLERSDSALTDGLASGTNYQTWITLAHHEYWGPNAMQNLDAHLEQGGNVLNFAGNLFLWRSDVDTTDGVMETRKWPMRLGVVGEQDGPNADAESLIGGGEQTGAWRFLFQHDASGASTDARLDCSLGTIASTNACTGPLSECNGAWRTISTSLTGNWAWKELVAWYASQSMSLPSALTFGETEIDDGTSNTVYAVGHENDALLLDTDAFDPPRLTGTIDLLGHAALSTFEHGRTTSHISYKLSTTTIAAYMQSIYEMYGSDVFRMNGATADTANFWNVKYAVPMADPTVLTSLVANPDAETRRHAAIVRYTTDGGGQVVSVPATGAAWALGLTSTSTGMDPLEFLVRQTLRCFVWGDGNCM